MTAPEAIRAEKAEERGQGICRTCLAPIWNEGGTVGNRKRAEGWSDRIERGGDSLVCFKAIEYRHVPLTGREACIYDHAEARGRAEAAAKITSLGDEWIAEAHRMGYATDLHFAGTVLRALAADLTAPADRSAS